MCNGEFVWKIDKIHQRFGGVEPKGKTRSVPFYTSPNAGYKLRLGLLLKRDSTDVHHCTHISIYIQVMKGEYDEVLRWPFQKTVTMMIVSQDKMRNDKSLSFVPSPFSSCSQKPKSKNNPFVGYREFAPVSVLTDPSFVKNDIMYIKVNID